MSKSNEAPSLMMVPEHIIDQVSEEVGAEEKGYDEALAALKKEQPIVLAYLFSESFEVFSQKEREYLLFLVMVVYQSVRKCRSVEPVGAEALESAEEKNWSMMEGVKAKRFRDRLDVFFEGYPQEDLLAFAEDSLIDADAEDTELVLKESREPLFIILKSLIDCFTVRSF